MEPPPADERDLTRRAFLARAGLTAAGVSALTLVACTPESKDEGRSGDGGSTPADLVMLGGAVHTVNEDQPWAQAVAVRGGVIAFVGSTQDAQAFVGPDTNVIDLQGRLVLPGFQDDHIHIQEANSPAYTSFLRPSGTPATELVPKMRGSRPGAGDWVLGWGFSIDELIKQVQHGRMTPRQLLDRAIPDHPAVMMEENAHAAWANSLALRLAGITADSPNPPGGVIVRDAAGVPDGLLLDSAGDRLFDVALARTPEFVDLQYTGLMRGMKELAKNGITSVADARVYWKRADLQVWKRAEAEGTLTARTTLGLWAYPDMDDDTQIAKLTSMYDPNPEGLLHVSQIKVYSDGITLNGTAAMLAPYEPSFLRYLEPLGIGSTTGINYFDAERLARYTTELERVGFDMHIHVLGDRGAHEALNAVESAIRTNGPDTGRRHRTTHNELVAPEDIPRYAELGVIADIQVSGDWTLPDAWADNRFMVGARGDDFIPLRSIYDTGALVTLSSDWDVSSMDPLVGIQHALSRDPEACRAWTPRSAPTPFPPRSPCDRRRRRGPSRSGSSPT